MSIDPPVELPLTEAELGCLINDLNSVGLSLCAMFVRRLAFERDRLKEENNRLRSGELTEVEIHNLCHRLNETNPTCTRHEFERGCREFQDKLFGEKKSE